MATNYTGNVTPSLSNAPANAWTDDATKASHVGNTYLVTGSGGTAGNVYAFEEYAAPLVKNASGLPADIVTITDGGENLPMVKAEVSLSPIQSGSGDPSPTNVRPITGHDSATLNIGAEYPTADETYPVTFPQTVYGGTYDWVSGKLKVTHVKYVLTGDDFSTSTTKESNLYRCNLININFGSDINYKEGLCNKYAFRTSYANVNNNNASIAFNSSQGSQILIRDDTCADGNALKAAATAEPIEVVYPLATAQEYTLTPAQVQTLLGLNNVWASDGQISALTYKSNQFIPKYDWFETWNMPKITRDNGTVIVLPYPQEYTPEIYDVDASTTGRNAAGTMIRDRVARKHKFNYKFPPLGQADATEILNAVQDVSFTLTTASPETGAKTNYRVYVGDRSLPVYWMPTHDNASWLYSSLSLNLIEM